MNRWSVWWLPGLVALLVVLSLTIAPLFSLITTASNIDLQSLTTDTYIRRVIGFSFLQATASTGLAILLAIPVAVALSREPQFFGRSLLINLFSFSFVLPTVVAVFGLIAVYGRTGWVNDGLMMLGIERFSIYGLPGILLAHVFFNMPLSARIFLQALGTMPEERWRVAAQLGMTPTAQFRFLEWPIMKTVIPGLAILIFSLCFTSFSVVMILGGGPGTNTIEVAIYQALRFDFDLNTAVSLAIVQFVICSVIVGALMWLPQQHDVGFSLQGDTLTTRPKSGSASLHRSIIAVTSLAFLLPVAGLFVSAINPAVVDVLLEPSTFKAVVNTVLVSLASASMATLLAMGLLTSTRHIRFRMHREQSGRALQAAGYIILVLPPIVLGTGLFLLLRPYADVFSYALLLVVAINALMALPFVLRILDTPMTQFARENDRLIQSLGISGLNRFRVLDWPTLRQPVGLALGVSAALAAGDLSAIALFGSDRAVTLSLLLYQRMGSYRLFAAAVTAVLLLLVCLALFIGLQRLLKAGRHA